MRPLRTFLAIALVVVAPAAVTAEQPVSGLIHIQLFAIGGIGVAGSMSEGERDLRAVMNQRDAATQLREILSRATPAGQLYALRGLRMRDRAAYEQALPALRKRSDAISTARGCILNKEEMAEIVREIEHGDFDAALARPPW